MSDTAQLNLREPVKTDWDNYNTGSTYQAPPPAQDAAGNFIVYTGVIEEIKVEDKYPAKDAEGNPYLTMNIAAIRLVNAGQHEGYVVKFTNASVKPFEKNGEPMRGNPSKLGNALKSAGLQAKPQSNTEWLQAANMLKGKKVQFTIDWQGRNRDTGEEVKGYLSFPEDSERPGQRKSILKAGDTVTERDNKGQVVGTKIISSDVLFANAKLRFFELPPARPRS